jgi:hypothetical protein
MVRVKLRLNRIKALAESNSDKLSQEQLDETKKEQ